MAKFQKGNKFGKGRPKGSKNIKSTYRSILTERIREKGKGGSYGDALGAEWVGLLDDPTLEHQHKISILKNLEDRVEGKPSEYRGDEAINLEKYDPSKLSPKRLDLFMELLSEMEISEDERD